jgi:hypothetical protein
MMNRQTFLIVAAAVSVVTGIAGLLAPAQLASVFGVTLDDAGASEARLLGASYLGYAAIVWFARDIRDVATQRAIALGSVLSWTLSLVVMTAAVVTGVAGTPAWLLVAIAVVFAAGWGYIAVTIPGRPAAKVITT